MEVWRSQLEQRKDLLVEHPAVWDELLDMVAAAPDSGALNCYLELLLQRLNSMRRGFNWVKCNSTGVYIHNYTFLMYLWAKRKGNEKIVIDEMFIWIARSALTDVEYAEFKKRRE